MVDDNKVCIVGCYKSGFKDECEEFLIELEELLYSCDLVSGHKFLCPIRDINPATFIGSGKVAEIAEFLAKSGINQVVFDDEILPSQQRNLEKALKVPVMDRAEVILNVFSRKARTKEAKLQVELARIKYTIPRLKRLWTHLSRQRGGGVNQKGEGEAQLELDKRILRSRETALKKDLEEVKKQRDNRRVSKQRSSIFNFTIVGYTNAGKSSLMNLLTKADVLSEDKLFATLDTTTRAFEFPNKLKVILTDTVGFIRKLPHFLVSSFRSTLEESLGANCLIKLVDLSNHSYKSHMDTIESVLSSLSAESKEFVLAFNKCDLVDDVVLQEAKTNYPNAVFLSVKNEEGIEDLLDIMHKIASSDSRDMDLKIPMSEYDKVTFLHQIGSVITTKVDDEFILVKAKVPEDKVHIFTQYLNY